MKTILLPTAAVALLALSIATARAGTAGSGPSNALEVGGQVPTPTALILLSPPASPEPMIDPSLPLSDADAAAQVASDTYSPAGQATAVTPNGAGAAGSALAAAATTVSYLSSELVPANNTYNHTMPTSAQLRSVASISWLTGAGNYYIHQATGHYTGTTGQILTWAAKKWGFDPNIVMAVAQGESHWKQSALGDAHNGYSWGIMQVKQRSFAGTYPISHTSTAFNADFKLAYQRACVNNDIPYLAKRTPAGGHAKYYSATGAEKIWGCVGNWYSGGWYDAGAINYINKIKWYYNNHFWTSGQLNR